MDYASGMSEDEILTDFPDLEREDIKAALACGGAGAQADVGAARLTR